MAGRPKTDGKRGQPFRTPSNGCHVTALAACLARSQSDTKRLGVG